MIPFAKYLAPRKPGNYRYGDFILDYEPFYVGKGKGNRDSAHLSQPSLMKHNRQLLHKTNKIKNLGLYPIIIRISENLLEKEALDLESKIVKLIGRKNLNSGVLLNLTDGGEGTSNKIWPPGSIESIKEKNKNKIVSLETRKKQSEAQKGKTRSRESLDKMKIHHYKPVIMYDKNMEIIGDFSSIQEASLITGHKKEKIGRLVREKTFSKENITFRYKIKDKQ